MQTVLITGATGALAQAVIEKLQKNGNYHVVATSRNSKNNDFQLDVRNTEKLIIILNRIKPDLILHLAATFENDFNEAYATNVEATRQLLEQVQQSGLSTRVLLIGSAAEYGAVKPEDNPIREDHVLTPVSIYGLTKAWQTQLAGFYASRGVDVVVARAFNLDGTGLSERLFIGRLQKQINDVLAGLKSAIELGSLTATRDYISTNEAAEQLLAIADHAETGLVYHVASGNPVMMNDILNRYLTKHKIDVSKVHTSAVLTNHIGYDVPVIYADVTNTMQLMKYWKEAHGEA